LELKVAIGKQLRYVNRALKTVGSLLCAFSENTLKEKERTYVETLRKVLVQQTYMRSNKTHSVADRIMSIHQPQVRPIVRGKEKSKVEFGSKINVSLVEGYVFLDHLSWEAYNEGGYLMKSVVLYKDRHGYYPAEVLADMIYCNRENRRMLKELCIKLLAKPLGRPSMTNRVKLNPGERNPIGGKFGQAKVRYGMHRIRARLKDTSESRVAMILVVPHLVWMARETPYFWLCSAVSWMRDIFQKIIREKYTDRMLVSILFRYQLKLIQ
jgi:IS5 family transposase